MKYIVLLLSFSLVVNFSFAQKIAKTKSSDFFDANIESEVITINKVAVQGSILFKVFSYGKNEQECLDKAKMDAIKAVIFRGIPGSESESGLVTESGADEKYRDYFTIFFKKGGKYANYVSISNDGSINSNDRLRVGNRLKIGVVVLVKLDALRKELESAHIINKLGEG